MRAKNRDILLLGGLLLLAAALCLAAYNVWESQRAAEAAEEAAQRLKALPSAAEEAAPAEKEALSEEALPAEEAPETGVPAYILDPQMEMPTVEVDGNSYIGTLDIPALSLSLPVISRWSYPALRLAPCRYRGSAYLDNLIIAAHNYPKHFGGLSGLQTGDAVLFTDTEGNTFSYAVTELETLDRTAITEMETGDWDLTLFTCTLGGKSRVTVRCDRT